jgi:hypothetical protein
MRFVGAAAAKEKPTLAEIDWRQLRVAPETTNRLRRHCPGPS